MDAPVVTSVFSTVETLTLEQKVNYMYERVLEWEKLAKVIEEKLEEYTSEDGLKKLTDGLLDSFGGGMFKGLLG